MSGRAPLLAQETMREAIDRALEAKLTMREMKVFLALLKLISHYDRTEDRIANRQIVEPTGIDERHVRRALHSLVDKGVIWREVGTGRRASLISLVPPDDDDERPPSAVEGATRAPTTEPVEGANDAPPGGAGSDARGGRFEPVAGTPGEPASEVLSEASSEVCVADLAFSKLNLPKGADTFGQRCEREVKLKGLVNSHGEDAIRQARNDTPPGATFAGDLIRHLKAELPDEPRAFASIRSVLGRHDEPSVRPPCPNPFELDEHGNAIRRPIDVQEVAP